VAAATRIFESARPFFASPRPPDGGNGHGQDSGQSPGNPSVLIVEDDQSLSEIFTEVIVSLGVHVVAARDGRQALAAAHRSQFNLWLLDLKLRDLHGLDVVRQLRAEGVRTPFIVVSGSATVQSAVEATKLGALAVLEKPVRLEELYRVVGAAVASTALDRLLISDPRTPFERWCNFLIRLVTSEYDLKTDGRWAKHLGVSLSTLRDCCKRLDLKVEDARNFARALRAISQSDEYWAPELVLDIDDRRTLKRFEERSGIERGANPHGRAPRTPTIQSFFERQTWLPRDNFSVLAFKGKLIRIGDPSSGSFPTAQARETQASGNVSSDAAN
jgi:CheY-like chemotaxis protein